MYDFDHEIDDLSGIVGRTPTAIWQEGNEELFFRFSDGFVLRLNHTQDCCESVYIEDVVGDWSDLVGQPLLSIEVKTDTNSPKMDYGYEDESSTWTFYTFRGNGGTVDLRWYGTSNGYYSENVDAFLFAPHVAEKRGMKPPQEKDTL